MKPFPKIVKRVHLYLGLSCGILASISGITGSMYVWQPEITAALNPQLLQVDSFNKIPEATLLKTTLTLYETQKDTIAKIFLPYREQQTISVESIDGSTLYYHPESGRVLGRKSSSISFFEGLLNIHRTLGIPGIGKYIVGSSTVLFLLFLLTSGLYLWWKKYKFNFRKGIKIKWRRNRKRFNYEIHNTLGILFFVPLILMAFTGGYFTYHAYYKKGFQLVDNFSTNPKPEKIIQKGTGSDINELLNHSDIRYSLRAIYIPKDSCETYQFRYIKDRFIVPGLRKTRELELAQNGVIMNTTSFESAPFSEQIAAQMYPVHTGEMGGLPGRILVFISGFIPVILFITGLRFYTLKKHKFRNPDSVPYYPTKLNP